MHPLAGIPFALAGAVICFALVLAWRARGGPEPFYTLYSAEEPTRPYLAYTGAPPLGPWGAAPWAEAPPPVPLGPTKSAFAPRPVSVCGGRPAAEYAAPDPRGSAGTVSPLPPAAAERGAGGPELNPYTGLGRTSRVRAWGAGPPGACQRRSIFELQPGEPGYLEPIASEPSPALRSGHCSAPLASPAAEFRTDGAFGDALAGAL